jgi:hypothetical protein
MVSAPKTRPGGDFGLRNVRAGVCRAPVGAVCVDLLGAALSADGAGAVDDVVGLL